MSADRIFLDANILFSIAYGSPGLDRLWELAKKGHCVLLASRYVIEEAKRNLNTPEQLNNLKAYLSDVQIVLEADQSIVCTIFTTKRHACSHGRYFRQGRLSDHR